MSTTIGALIIDRIIAGSLMHASCAHDPMHGCMVVWSSGAVEQLDALVAEYNAQYAHELGAPIKDGEPS